MIAVTAIEAAVAAIPAEVRARSGSIFYSGREAFEGRRDLYLLGLNPGGDPLSQAAETIERHIVEWSDRSEPWSAYADDSWRHARPGMMGIQPRVLHMLAALNMDPRFTPASNVVFVRSHDETALRLEKERLLEDCWPVHHAVIETLEIKVIVCFGGTAGRWVREQFGAHDLVDVFVETNSRGWRNEAHRGVCGQMVITVTHPSRADWRNPAADPTPLVKRILGQV